ncbi:MAG: hypothetical protein ACT452_07950 [Microthrixaceae bacterium]
MPTTTFTGPHGAREATEAGVPDAALRGLVASRIRRLLRAGGIDPGEVTCRIEHEAAALRVTLEVPRPVSTSVQNALKVRVLDAIGGLGENMGQVKVTVEPPRQPSPALAIVNAGREWDGRE